MPKTPEKYIRDLFEDRARAGDGSFAVAYALLNLAEAQEATSRALNKLGVGDASTPFGAIEALGMQIEKAATILGEKAENGLESFAHAKS